MWNNGEYGNMHVKFGFVFPWFKCPNGRLVDEKSQRCKSLQVQLQYSPWQTRGGSVAIPWGCWILKSFDCQCNSRSLRLRFGNQVLLLANSITTCVAFLFLIWYDNLRCTSFAKWLKNRLCLGVARVQNESIPRRLLSKNLGITNNTMKYWLPISLGFFNEFHISKDTRFAHLPWILANFCSFFAKCQKNHFSMKWAKKTWCFFTSQYLFRPPIWFWLWEKWISIQEIWSLQWEQFSRRPSC